MLYLIISLVTGLFFLISGKVKYGKTLYLEGAKARIAGLIFLAPLGLILFAVVAGSVYESIAKVSDTKAFEQTLDNLASALVRNGFMIGLAYINFYSVSRETKNRGGCLTYGLAYATYIAVLLLYFLSNLLSNVQWHQVAIAALSITFFQIISIIGIWLWKKWGVFGYAATTMITPIIPFIRVGFVSQSFVSLIQSLSLILVLYLLVRPKWQFFE